MTRLAALGRPVFLAVLVGFLIILLVTLPQLPPTVASHFDGSGVPNAWSSRPWYATLMLLIGAGLPLAIVGLVCLLTRRGPELLNLPAREYWLRPEHAAEAVRRTRQHIWWLGAVLTVSALAVHISVLGAHRVDPPRLGATGILLVIGLTLVAIGLWALFWYRLFRVPR